jgi:hypothetical protein
MSAERHESEPKGPQIDIKPQTVFCPVHGCAFARKWPAGFLGFSIKAFTLATENNELWKAADGDADRLNAAIAEFGPLCRLLTPEQRLEAYQHGAEISVDWPGKWVCENPSHRKSAAGVWTDWRTPHGMVRRFICFECLAAMPCGD